MGTKASVLDETLSLSSKAAAEVQQFSEETVVWRSWRGLLWLWTRFFVLLSREPWSCVAA